MPATHPPWPPWRPVLLATLLALALAALAALTAAGRHGGSGGDAAPRPVAARSAAATAGAAAADRVCVTPRGVCPAAAAAARAGDPCGCPHPLRGSVPGHVERVGGVAAPALSGGRDWPGEDQDPADPLAALGPLHGP